MVLGVGAVNLDGQPLIWILRYVAGCNGVGKYMYPVSRVLFVTNRQASGVRNELPKLAKGVYFGYAQLEGEKESRQMVMNVGNRPTFADGDEVSVCKFCLFIHNKRSDKHFCLNVG